jgi:hypothetical protein
MRNHFSSLPFSLAATIVFAACASQPKQETTAQLAKAEGAIREAEQFGAQQGALPDLQQARDKLAEAQHALDKKKEPEAMRLAQQAQVDAQYASAKAQALSQQKAASQAMDSARSPATDVSSTPR